MSVETSPLPLAMISLPEISFNFFLQICAFLDEKCNSEMKIIDAQRDSLTELLQEYKELIRRVALQKETGSEEDMDVTSQIQTPKNFILPTNVISKNSLHCAYKIFVDIESNENIKYILGKLLNS